MIIDLICFIDQYLLAENYKVIVFDELIQLFLP